MIRGTLKTVQDGIKANHKLLQSKMKEWDTMKSEVRKELKDSGDNIGDSSVSGLIEIDMQMCASAVLFPSYS